MAMDESDVDDEQITEIEYEDTKHRACYIFHSSQKRNNEPPRKKRKLNDVNGSSKSSSDLSLGITPRIDLQERHRFFHDFWQQKNAQFEAFTGHLDEDTLSALVEFVNTPAFSIDNERLQTALLLTGIESTIYEQIIGDLRCRLGSSGVVVDLQARQCPNLQNTLKAIIKTAIVGHSGLDAYESHLSKHKRLIPLNFDLELLELFAKDHAIENIAISFREVERFDAQLLNELIDTFRTWKQRLGFILLLEVGSTVELLEFRLSKVCVNTIDAQKFDFGIVDDFRFPLLVQMQSEVSDGPQILLGPNLVNSVFNIFQDQGNMVQSIARTLEHAYMSHFYTNTLATLTTGSAETDVWSLCNTIRHMHSFRQYCEDLLEQADTVSLEKVRRFLEDDEYLIEEAKTKVVEGQQAYAETCEIIHACSDFYHCASQGSSDLHFSTIEVALDLYRSLHDLLHSDTFVTLETFLSSTTVPYLHKICKNLQPSTYDIFISSKIREMLEQETQKEDRQGTNGINGYINGNSICPPPTTQKYAKTSKSNSKSKPESVKAMLIESMRDKLKSASLDLSELFLHETYILSSRTVRSKQVSESNPRTAVERALLTPGDYLGCECVTQSQRSFHEKESMHRHSTQHGRPPPASILFTLLQEAPTNINLRDLFDAFASRYEQDSSTPVEVQSSEEADSETIKARLAQFYQALAELRLAGFIKTSTGMQVKKKIAGRNAKVSSQDVDFIAKTSWLGM